MAPWREGHKIVGSPAHGGRGAAATSAVFHVSTEMFSEKERFSAFREEFVRRHLAMDVIDHSGGRPHADMTLMPLGPVGLLSLDTTPAEYIRDERHLKDGRGDAFPAGAGPERFGPLRTRRQRTHVLAGLMRLP
jgi:hypothetical protein